MPSPPTIDRDELSLTKDERLQLERILRLVLANSGNNFTPYKDPTLLRRIKRRMGLCNLTEFNEYEQLLKKDNHELNCLCQDLLIKVTYFFRDKSVFSLIEKEVFPSLLQKMQTTKVRIWVAGCSTGEEAFSIGMLLLEACKEAKLCPNFQVFATDVGDDALTTARQGVYPHGVKQRVPAFMLERYFTKEADGYRVTKKLREIVVFAKQNILSDPPFTKIDFLLCRNLLIYINPKIQQQILRLFHFSLNTHGFLLLGTSETIGRLDHLFELISKKERLFRARDVKELDNLHFPIVEQENIKNLDKLKNKITVSESSVRERINHHFISYFQPAAVLVNVDGEVVYFFGKTSRYLEIPTGIPKQQLLSLLVEPLRTKVRAALYQAISKKQSVNLEQVTFRLHEQNHTVNFSIEPYNYELGSDLYLLIIAEEPIYKSKHKKSVVNTKEGEIVIRQLESELHSVQEDLQSTIEEMESANEELKASNEEVTSMYEELQSTNEELETSKEELHTLNEELTNVNKKLTEKIKEQTRTKNDVLNLLKSTNLATVFLDEDLCIRRFTPAVTQLISLIDSDKGRPISDISVKFKDPSLLADCKKVLQNLVPERKEIISQENRIYMREILPYRTCENRVEGVVVTFTDVTALKESQSSLKDKERTFQKMLDATPYLISYVDSEENYIYNNLAHAKWCGWSAASGEKRSMQDIYPPSLYELAKPYIARVLKGEVTHFDWNGQDQDGEHCYHQISYVPDIVNKKVQGFYVAGINVTNLKAMQLKMQKEIDKQSKKLIDSYNALKTEMEKGKRLKEKIVEDRIFLNAFSKISPVGFYYTTSEMYCLYANDAGSKFLGVEPEEVVGEGWMNFLHPEEKEENLKLWYERTSNGKPFDTVMKFLSPKTNKPVWVHSRAEPHVDDNGHVLGYFGCVTDVTKQREAEIVSKHHQDEAAHMERLCMAGELVSCLSHEVNQPLTSIVQYIGAGINRLKSGCSPDEVISLMERMMAQAERAGEVVHRLKSFLRKGEMKKQPECMLEIIDNVLQLLKHEIEKNNITITQRCSATVSKVTVDRIQIEQVLLNLIKNAIDAVNTLPPNSAKKIDISFAAVKKNHLCVKVSDNGPGLGVKATENIFDNFFTTKENGMGLGLTISRSIIEAHGGTLKVDESYKDGFSIEFCIKEE